MGTILTLLLVVASGAGVWEGERATVARAAPLAQAAPGPLVKQAFDLLMDRFVTPPSSQTLLAGGWEGGARFVQERASATSPGAPTFSGDRAKDWEGFQGAYPGLVTVLAGAGEQVELDRAIVGGMAASLVSSHTKLRPPEVVITPQAQERYAGVGIRVTPSLTVAEVFPGSPAEAAGVRLADQVVAVDGAPVAGLTPQQLGERVRGPVGSTASITVQRAGAFVEFTIARAEVNVDWASSRVLDDQIGYLRIRVFASPNELALLDQAVARLSGAHVRALVIDVRGVPGGQSPAQVASRFIQDADLMILTNRENKQRLVRTSGGFWGQSVPIVVLVDSQSESAAELLAAFLREHRVADIIGTPTVGAVENGVNFSLSDGSQLLIATESIKTAGGTVLEKNPLQPDIVAELDPALLVQGKDSQLEAALAHLRGKLGR